jgi:hypothetical protein
MAVECTALWMKGFQEKSNFFVAKMLDIGQDVD